MQGHLLICGLVTTLGFINLVATLKPVKYALQMGIIPSTHHRDNVRCEDGSFHVRFKGEHLESKLHAIPKTLTSGTGSSQVTFQFHGIGALGRLTHANFIQTRCSGRLGIVEIYVADMYSGEVYGRSFGTNNYIYLERHPKKLLNKYLHISLYQFKNLALKRPTGTTSEEFSPETKTSNAIDGYNFCLFTTTSVTTTSGDQSASWYVTLHEKYDIWAVVIYPLQCCFKEMQGVEIKIGKKLKTVLKSCGYLNSVKKYGPVLVNCRGVASFVYMETWKPRLELCEVKIYGRPVILKIEKSGTLGNADTHPQYAADLKFVCNNDNHDSVTKPQGNVPANWYVKLLRTHYITNVFIHAGFRRPLQNIVIKIGMDLDNLVKCADYSGPSIEFELINLPCFGLASYVYIENTDLTGDLRLCEVEVLADKVETWSEWRKTPCPSPCVFDGLVLNRARHRLCNSQNGGICDGMDSHIENLESVITDCASSLCEDSNYPTDVVNPECLDNENGDEEYFYEGTKTVTKSGKQCQRWDATSPHKPLDHILAMGFSKLVKMKNYCRSTEDDPIPWCYTMDADVRWEECGIPFCNDECLRRDNKRKKDLFIGTTSVTKSGRTCQSWDSFLPHVPARHILDIDTDTRTTMKNYCRLAFHEDKTPWCYTTDPKKRFDDCDISKCEITKVIKRDMPECLGNKTDGIHYFYAGTKSVTDTGRTCQSWDSIIPHKPSPGVAKSIKYVKKNKKNYCWNPEVDPIPWCYTTDPKKRWEYCGIPNCDSTVSLS